MGKKVAIVKAGFTGLQGAGWRRTHRSAL